MTIQAKWIYRDGEFIAIEWIETDKVASIPQIDNSEEEVPTSDAA